MKKLLAICLCAAVIFSLTSCRHADSKPGKGVAYHLPSAPQTLDPQVAGGEGAATIVGCLYEGLCRLGENGEATPGVAESWESSDNGKTFTFHLREDAVWTGAGKERPPVTASDFVFAWRRALTPATGSPSSAALLCLQNASAVLAGERVPSALGVQATDARTLVVNLAYPIKDFPALTAQAVYMPCNEAFFIKSAGRYGIARDTLLSNGPFSIDGRYGWDAAKFLNLKQSPSYNGERNPVPATVTLHFGRGATGEVTVSDPVAALTSGMVDAIALPTQYLPAAEAAGCALTSFSDSTWGLCFNTASPLLQNADIRKALTLSLSRSALTAQLPAGAVVAEDILPPVATLNGSNYRAAAGSSFYPRQASAAAEHMAAGLAALGLGACPGLTVLCPDDPAAQAIVNEMLTTWNNAFNQYFNMSPLTEEKLTAAVASGNYDIAVCPLRSQNDGPAALLGLFKSGAQGNLAALKSPDFDALLGKALTGGLAADYAAAERFLCEECVFYPLYLQSRYYAAAPGVSGISFRPYGGGIDFFFAKK